MDKFLLNLLICPGCQGALTWDKKAQELICKHDALAYPVRDGIPILLVQEARALAQTTEIE